MSPFLRTALAAGTVAAMAAMFALPASAACTRLGFSVNDYGKEGPANDAKMLLDKYVAKWAGERGIPKYTTGKKDVTCELFLDFVVFDEYTCRAEATICWDGPAVPGMQEAKAEGSDTAPASADAPAAKPKANKTAAKPKTDAAPQETGAIERPAPAAKAAEKPAEPAAPAAAEAAAAPAPAAAADTSDSAAKAAVEKAAADNAEKATDGAADADASGATAAP
ncbi:MAG: hypothetical protein ACRCS9_15995 [Hyphomicrobium sp.]